MKQLILWFVTLGILYSNLIPNSLPCLPRLLHWAVISLSSTHPVILCFLVLLPHWPSITPHDTNTKTSDDEGKTPKWNRAGALRLDECLDFKYIAAEDDRKNPTSLFPDWKKQFGHSCIETQCWQENSLLPGQEAGVFIYCFPSVSVYARQPPGEQTHTHCCCVHCCVCAPTSFYHYTTK